MSLVKTEPCVAVVGGRRMGNSFFLHALADRASTRVSPIADAHNCGLSDSQKRFLEENDVDYSKTSLWSFRIFGLMLLNILGYLDRLLTMAAVSKLGIEIEMNPLMKFLHINPWVHLMALTSVTALFGIFYVKSYRKSSLALDIALIMVLTGYVFVIANNIIQYAGIK